MFTKLLIEQHFHGAYGIDFNNAGISDIVDLSYQIKKEGIGAIFPTLVTDSIENIKRQISVIKKASKKQSSDCAKILGVHLEGIFLNPKKCGIHDNRYFLKPTIENFSLIEDDFIKIVTVAPEFCDTNFFKYLKNKDIKIQAGHCIGGDLSFCDGVTHTFNAMEGISHRSKSTLLSSLINDDIYNEIICDGVHVSDDALKLLFKAKPYDKILLVSDCLPCTHSNVKEFIFAGSKIYYDGDTAKSKSGTLAGSSKLLPDIVKILFTKGLFNIEYINNPYKYHKIDIDGQIEWDEHFNIVKVS
ncbi:hypothetical protein J6G99_03045 [bacterium]|nr:hypothetical protein [bacterium]